MVGGSRPLSRSVVVVGSWSRSGCSCRHLSRVVVVAARLLSRSGCG